MGSSMLRWISQNGAADNSLRCIFPGIFRSPNSCCGGRGARMFSTVNSDESPSSSSRISSSPWLMLSPRSDNTAYNFYSFAENKVLSFGKAEEESEFGYATKIVGSSHGWLTLFNHRRNCELFLTNPLSRRRINLPPIHNLPIPAINLRGGYGCVDKVIISCSPDDDEEEECRAMMCFGTANGLAFCWPGRSTEWTIIGNEIAIGYEDFVYSSTQKLFFSISLFPPRDLEGWDLGDPLSPRLDWVVRDYNLGLELEKKKHPPWPSPSEEEEEEEEWELRELRCEQRKYLVVSPQSNKEEFFLVIRYINPRMRSDGSCAPDECKARFWDISLPYKTMDFEVYKIVREGKGGKMIEMEGHLDGLVMFVGGAHHAFAMSAASDGFPPPNSICFTDDKYGRFTSAYGGHDNGIFNYENKTFSSCYYPCDYQSIKRIVPPPLWFTPSLP